MKDLHKETLVKLQQLRATDPKEIYTVDPQQGRQNSVTERHDHRYDRIEIHEVHPHDASTLWPKIKTILLNNDSPSWISWHLGKAPHYPTFLIKASLKVEKSQAPRLWQCQADVESWRNLAKTKHQPCRGPHMSSCCQKRCTIDGQNPHLIYLACMKLYES